MNYTKKPIATYVVLGICLLINMAVTFFNISSETETAIFFGAYYKSFVLAGEYWRLLTCGFVHISIFHLMMNGFSLLNIGSFFENRFGVIRYLLILFLSVIGGSLFSYCMEGNIVAVGLSGGLYGLMGGYIVMVMANGSWRDPQVLTQLVRVILINVMINFMPGIAVSAHLGGLLTGMIVTSFFVEIEKKFKIQMAAAALILCGVLGWQSVNKSVIRLDQVYLLSDYRVLSAQKQIGLRDHAFRMAANLDKIYDTGNALSMMLEDDDES